MNRRIIALLASLALAVGLCPALAFASTQTEGVANSRQLVAGLTADAPSGELSAQSFVNPKAKFSGVKTVKKYVKSKLSTGTQEYTAKAGSVQLRAYRTSTYAYDYQYTLEATVGGVTKTIGTTIAKDFVTNGRYVFFSMGMTPVDAGHSSNGYTYHYYTYKANIYRYDLKTGKAKKVAAGTDWKIFATNGTYLYCGPSTTSASNGKLYVKKIGATKKSTLLAQSPNQIEIKGNRAVFTSFRMQICCSKLYTSKVGSKSKKLIASQADSFRISGNKIIYMKGKYANGTFKTRVYRCSLTGKNKKALSGWSTDFAKLKEKYKLN